MGAIKPCGLLADDSGALLDLASRRSVQLGLVELGSPQRLRCILNALAQAPLMLHRYVPIQYMLCAPSIILGLLQTALVVSWQVLEAQHSFSTAAPSLALASRGLVALASPLEAGATTGFNSCRLLSSSRGFLLAIASLILERPPLGDALRSGSLKRLEGQIDWKEGALLVGDDVDGRRSGRRSRPLASSTTSVSTTVDSFVLNII